MATTIQISDTTKQMLEKLKSNEQMETYDKVIQHLVKKHTHVSKSMFGSNKKLTWRKEEDRMKFHEL